MSYRPGVTKPRITIPPAWDGVETARMFKKMKKSLHGRHNFLTSAIVRLRLDHDAEIVGFDFDQWFAVFVETETTEYYCECDLIEHGIAAILSHLNAVKESP